MGIVGWVYVALLAGTCISYLGWRSRPRSSTWENTFAAFALVTALMLLLGLNYLLKRFIP